MRLTSPSHRLEQLARRIGRLDERRVDPEAYHVEKSDIAGEIRAIAKLLRGATEIEPSPNWHRSAADADPRLRRKPANDNFFKGKPHGRAAD